MQQVAVGAEGAGHKVMQRLEAQSGRRPHVTARPSARDGRANKNEPIHKVFRAGDRRLLIKSFIARSERRASACVQ